jgi:GGDEF domain-containing protein
MTPENIYYIFNVKPHVKGHIERVLLGKFMLGEGKFEILEDHGLPKKLQTGHAAEAANIIHRLTTSMYFEVTNLQDLINGLHPELIKPIDAKAGMDDDIRTVIGKQATQEPQSSDFEYDRVGGEGPRVLSVSDGQVFLDGHLLTADEIERVQGHVKSGQAYLRSKLKKAESIYNPGMDPRMDRHLNEDSHVPGLGNLRAYNQFVTNAPPGLHIHINAHDMKHVNRAYGHETGHRAIRATGAAIQHIARSLIGPEARAFRLGGDKFMVHVPSTEGAALFARGLRQHLEGVPAINGTHRLAVSMGIGPTKEHAQWGLHESTAQKNRSGYQPGQSKTHVTLKIPGALDGGM